MMTDPIQTILSRLRQVRPDGRNRWRACCPAHDDKAPSLSLRQGDDGRALLFCHAGCPIEAIVSAMGLELNDLFISREESDMPMTEDRRIAAVYPYHDETGKLLYEVVRFYYRQRIAAWTKAIEKAFDLTGGSFPAKSPRNWTRPTRPSPGRSSSWDTSSTLPFPRATPDRWWER